MSAPDQESEAVIGPQHRMLELMYETFSGAGQQPTFQYVSGRVWAELQVDPRDLYLDVAERGLVSPAMTRSHQFQLREDTVVGVSLRGMMYLRPAAEDLGRFVSVVRYVADRAGRFRPPSATELARLSITSEEIRLHLELEPEDLALLRVGVLISQEAWQLWTSFAGPDADCWSFEVNLERARRYCDIHTIIEFLAVSYPEGQQQTSLPASPTSLGTTLALTTNNGNNKKVMVVHGRDKARDDLFNLLRALGLEPIEWSAAVKSTGTTKPYTGQAVEAAFATAQAAVILLVPEEQVALRNDLRDPKDPADEQLAWQPRPNVFYEGGIAVTSHPDQTIVLELGRPRTATDLAGVNTTRIGSDPAWRHNLAARLRDAGCPVNTDGTDWLKVGEFAEPELAIDENGEPLHGDNVTPGGKRNTHARDRVRVDVVHHQLEYHVGFSDPSGRAGFVARITVDAVVVDAAEMVRYGISGVKDVIEPALARAVVDANESGEAVTDDGQINRLTRMRQRASADTRKLEHKTLDDLPSWLSATVLSTSVDFDDTTRRHYSELVELEQEGEVIDHKSKNEEKRIQGQINVRKLWRDDLMSHLSSPSQRVFEQVYANPTDQNIAAAVHQANERELALLQEVVRSFEMVAREGYVEKDDPAVRALVGFVERLPHMSEPTLPQGEKQDVINAPPIPEEQAGDRDFKE